MSDFLYGALHARACIFDFDGVIMDTERYHFAAWQRAAAPLGLSFSYEEYLPLRSTGRPFIASYFERKAGRAFTDGEREGLFLRKQEAYADFMAHFSESDFLPGMPAFLRCLKAHSIPAAVATSSSQAQALSERFGIRSLFTAILGPELPLPKKPAPDLFLAAASALGVPPADCAVFEDSEVGIRAGLAAGMQVVAVGGSHPEGVRLAIDDFTCFLA